MARGLEQCESAATASLGLMYTAPGQREGGGGGGFMPHLLVFLPQ